MKEEKELIRIGELADRLGASKSEIRKLTEAGKIPGVQVGKQVRFDFEKAAAAYARVSREKPARELPAPKVKVKRWRKEADDQITPAQVEQAFQEVEAEALRAARRAYRRILKRAWEKAEPICPELAVRCLKRYVAILKKGAPLERAE